MDLVGYHPPFLITYLSPSLNALFSLVSCSYAITDLGMLTSEKF